MSLIAREMDGVQGGEAEPMSAQDLERIEEERETKRAAIRESIAAKAKQEEEREQKVDER